MLRFLHALVVASAPRLRLKDEGASQAFKKSITDGHAFSLNLANLCIRLCAPFVSRPDKLALIDASFPTQSLRGTLADADGSFCLAVV